LQCVDGSVDHLSAVLGSTAPAVADSIAQTSPKPAPNDIRRAFCLFNGTFETPEVGLIESPHHASSGQHDGSVL